jgi:hypothetical protein
MNLHLSTRLATVLVVGWIMSFAGCGKPSPKPETKPDTSKPADIRGTSTPVVPGPGSTSAVPVSVPAAPAVLPAQGPIQDAADRFLKDLRAAATSPGPFPAAVLGRVSPVFLKVIGKPVLATEDAARGYSPSAAEAWLRRAGGSLGAIGSGYGSSAGAVFVGTANNGAGHFLLRLVPAGSGWQVGWLQLGTAKANDPQKAASADEPFQDFAAQIFLDAITGTAAGSTDDRIALLGAILTPKLRAAFGADPFAQDKERGYDYSPAKLAPVPEGLTDPNGPYTRTLTGPGEFKIELTKGGVKKAWSLKLIKGTEPTEWFIDEFAPL